MDVVERPRPRRTSSRARRSLILDRVRAFLDEHGLGSGRCGRRRIGEGGGSNFSFLLERDGGALRAAPPPRPPLPPSAHDVVRESRLQLALAPLGIRVPRDPRRLRGRRLLGVPFYVMDYIDGDVVTEELPPPRLDDGRAPRLATTSSTRWPRSTPPT